MTIIPISFPGVDLTAFVPIFGQETVNGVDAKKVQPIAKFDELLRKLILAEPTRHLYQAFYVVFPIQIENQFRNYKGYSKFEITVANEAFSFTGVMSASFETWKDFIKYLKADELLIDFGYAFEKYFENTK